MLAPGVAGSCGNCGALLSTEDRFCPSCGTPSEPALSGQEQVDEPKLDSSGNGTEVLGSAPPPTPEAREAPEGEESNGEDLDARARRGLGRLFGRRSPG
jgi:hypothetical protein